MDVNPRFQRNLGVISAETMEKLARTHVLIGGVGGTGGQAAVDLARLGVGHLTLADFDTYEVHNINRQVGAFESTVGKAKVREVAKLCRDVNPAIDVTEVGEGITVDNCRRLVAGLASQREQKQIDYAFVIETIDISGVEAKKLLYHECRAQGLVVLTALMTGLGGTMHVFQPDPAAKSFEEGFVTKDGHLNLPRLVPQLAHYMGKDAGAPRDEYVSNHYMVRSVLEACFARQGHAPTCVIGATTAAGLLVSEMVRGLVLGEKQMLSHPKYVYVDFFEHKLEVRDVSEPPEG